MLDDVMPVCERTGVAFIPYYPLASGILTGKYVRGHAGAEGSRIHEQLTDDVRARILSDAHLRPRRSARRVRAGP